MHPPHYPALSPSTPLFRSAGGARRRVPARDAAARGVRPRPDGDRGRTPRGAAAQDRKSTSLNSSHLGTAYAVFCLDKKTMANTGKGILEGTLQDGTTAVCA